MLVTTVAEKPANVLAFDEEAFGLGITVAAGRTQWMTERAQFDQAFARLSERKQTRVGCIDQTENPLGRNTWFLALYQGPLLVPSDGVYTFASNSDDASFLSIDGQEVVNWGGGHEMEVRSSPLANRWLHRGQVTLQQGMHWVSYAHPAENRRMSRTVGLAAGDACRNERRAGATVPRRPRPANGGGPGMGVGRPNPPAASMCNAMAGRWPRSLPCLGLELRRPGVRLYTLVWGGPDGRALQFFPQEGWQQLDIHGQSIPVLGVERALAALLAGVGGLRGLPATAGAQDHAVRHRHAGARSV